MNPCNWLSASKSEVRDEMFATDGGTTPVRLFPARLRYVSFEGNFMKGGNYKLNLGEAGSIINAEVELSADLRHARA